MTDPPVTFAEPTWALVELFGRNVVAGQITETPIAGIAMLRVDVPPVNGKPGYTKFYGGAAIYAITPTDQASALHAAAHLDAIPIATYVIPYRQLQGGQHTNDGEDYP